MINFIIGLIVGLLVMPIYIVGRARIWMKKNSNNKPKDYLKTAQTKNNSNKPNQSK